MFNKKKCGNCGEKTNDKYNFCPYCRASLTEPTDPREWGMLGKNDSMDNIRVPVGLDKMLNNLMKGLAQQMNDLDKQKAGKKEIKKPGKQGGISISIVTSGNRPPEIKVKSFGNANAAQQKQAAEKQKKIKLPQSDSSKFIGLPREEPETNVRRLSTRLVYEIDLHGVKSPDDISIIQLESSIEIKALGKDKVYHKVLPVNLPIRSYELVKGKLTIELDSRE